MRWLSNLLVIILPSVVAGILGGLFIKEAAEYIASLSDKTIVIVLTIAIIFVTYFYKEKLYPNRFPKEKDDEQDDAWERYTAANT